MSDLLIKGATIPQGCRQCHFKKWTNLRAGWFCPLRQKFLSNRVIIQDKRYDDCPLITVPSHGRLIDADRLENIFWDILNKPDEYDKPLHDMMLELQTAPTVIESEEQGNEVDSY